MWVFFLKIVKIFVTGSSGYVGSVLTNMLIEQKYNVTGCDVGYYPQNLTLEKHTKENSLQKDIRNITREDLLGYDAVLHLAALSNDPLGEINSSLTNEINYKATIRLAKLSKEAGVEKFIFSSSCSSYGSNDDIVNENSKLAPITAYAISKVNSERELIKLKDDKFFPVNLRSATAYGISSNLRLDLVVNNLTCSAFTTGAVKLLSDGTAWRPLVHVEDMSNAFIQVLKSSGKEVSGESFNVGANEDNYKVYQIAELVESIVPNSKIGYSKNSNKDLRSYQVNFDKIKNEIGYKTKWNLENGIKHIYEIFKNKKITENDFTDKKFYRVKYIKWLIEQKKIDSNLFFKE
jgi:nucleoside-diphosphate-sugar epimerase